MFFKSSFISSLDNQTIMRHAPAVFAEAPKTTTSEKYLFIPTIRLVDGLRSNGWEVVSAAQQMNRATDAENRMTNKHALFFARRDAIGSSFNRGDVLPLIKLENSHNGLSSFALSTGFFRKACANGLTVPESIYSAPTVKHTVNLRDDVIEATYKVLNDFPMLMEMQKALSGVELSLEEKLLLGDTAADLFFEKEEREKLNGVARKFHNEKYLLEAQLISPRRYDDRKSDLWTVSNVVQENLIRGNVRVVNGAGALASKRKVTSIDRDKEIHEKLFALTQKFAALKGVKIGSAVA